MPSPREQDEPVPAFVPRADTHPRPVAGERAGDVIDRYTLIEEIGEGGMGSVWRAHQSEPVKRDVALKIIKLGMDTKEIVVRFEAERQALAMMDHPHIAKVLDGGATLSGRPYFVMELVDGNSITGYCDQAKLDVRQRLGLFAKVCEGIQHAHQKGLIHRDIKPGNVLVTLQDGDPVPKVIDFGIAKATGVALTQESMHTRLGQMLGTPEYMAPEQLGLSGLDIDTRADVYSLGVLLYELLTGSKPFDVRVVIEGGYDELLRTIREVDPEKPSTRITNLVDTASVAELRQLDVRSFSKELSDDLDWIVMKCLEKDRSRRYETANELAGDIRRHLANEPVSACPPSKRYKLKKFVKRNRIQVIAGVAIALVLLLGLAGTGLGLAWAVDERDRADDEARRALSAADAEREAKSIAKANEQKAVAEARRAEQAEADAKARARDLQRVAAFQAEQLGEMNVALMGTRMRTSILEGLSEEHRPSIETALEDLNFTNLAMRTLEENLFGRTVAAIDRQFADQPLVQAQLLQSLSGTLKQLGLLSAAVDPQQRALSLRRQHLGEDHLDTLDSLFRSGVLDAARGDRVTARVAFEESIERWQRAVPVEDPDILLVRSHLANLLINDGQPAEAEKRHRELLDAQRRLLGPRHPQTLSALSNIAEALEAQGKYTDAEPYYHESLDATREVYGELHPKTLIAINNLGAVLHSQGELAQAEVYRRKALEGARQMLGDTHPETLTFAGNLGNLLDERGEREEAKVLLREALDGQLRTLGRDHPSTLGAMGNLGLTLSHLGEKAEAERYFRQALDGQRALLGDDHPDTVGSMNNLAMHLRKSGRPTEAEPLYRAALEGHLRLYGEDHPSTLISYSNMGAVLDALGRPDEAVPFCQAGLDGALRHLGPDHPTTLSMLYNTGYLLKALGRDTEALGYFHDAYVGQLRVLGEAHATTRATGQSLAGSLAEAVSRARAGDDAIALSEALSRSGEASLLFGDADRAARELAEAQELFPPEYERRRLRTQAALGAALASLGAFEEAEGLLLESTALLLEESSAEEASFSRLDQGSAPMALEHLASLYAAWHAAEPTGGHDAQESQWRAALAEWRAKRD